jgi:hypothetical protein
MAQVVGSTFQIDRNFDAFIATGTVPLKTGQGLHQTTGKLKSKLFPVS